MAVLARSPRGFPKGERVQVRAVGGEEHRWTSTKHLDTVVNTVCAPCNNGWMSTVEDTARPHITRMIEGRAAPERLDEAAQRAMATWIALRTLVSRSIYDPIPTPMRQWYGWMYSKRECPKPWHVWIGAYDGMLPAHYESHTVHPFVKSPSGMTLDTSDCRGVTMTLIAGYFAVKLAWISGATARYGGGTALARIAPPESPEIDWPPDTVLTDKTIVKFFNMNLSSASELSKHWDEIQKS